MKIIANYRLIAVATMAVSLAFATCRKDSGPGGPGYMQMKMTDAPGDYLQVNVDIRSVEVYHEADGDPAGWVQLRTRAGIYDLMDLQNDVTVVLADNTQIPSGRVGQLRLILGNGNTVMLKDGSLFPLVIPSSQNTGIKINLSTDVEPGRTTHVLLDFDADKSVNVLGNDVYQVKPVIHVKSVVVQ